MSSGTIEQVEQNAVRVLRQQPHAHGQWQFFYRNGRFRQAIGDFHKALYAMSVESYSDEQLQAAEDIARVVIKIIEVHVSRLGDGVRDVVDREYFQPIIKQLETAVEGLEQGLPPDPSKRPTRDQLLDRFASMLASQPINLPDRKDCAPAGTS